MKLILAICLIVGLVMIISPPGANCQFQCQKEGYFADLENCSKYYRCINIGGTLYPYSYTCPGTSLYCENLNRCSNQPNDGCKLGCTSPPTTTMATTVTTTSQATAVTTTPTTITTVEDSMTTGVTAGFLED